MRSQKEIRMTKQRRTIMEVLGSVNNHPPADEIYEKVRRRLPHISLGTVYRNLDILAEHGMIQKIEFAGSQMRFDGNASGHYHVRCTGCGSVADVSIKPLEKLEDELQGAIDYEIIGHRLEFIGLCPECKQQKQCPERAN